MGKEEENTNAKTRNEASRKECRLVVSEDAEAAVTELTDAVNDGFDAGKASRLDIASYMILWFKENAPSDAVSKLRRRFANGISMLDALQKKVKLTGDLPPELQAALENYFFNAASAVKKAKKPLRNYYISDIVSDSEVA